MSTKITDEVLRGQIYELQRQLVKGTPQDVTGWTSGDLTAYFGLPGAAPTATLTIGSGITLTTPATGIVTMTLSAAQLTVTPGAYVLELWVKRSGANSPALRATLLVRDSLEHYA